MSEYNPNKPDNYAVHLASMSTTGGVVATQDIFNEQGTLLIKKGNLIKDSSARLLLNHKLVAPLETSVSISDTLTAQQLYDEIRVALRADKENLAIHNAIHLEETLEKCCTRAMNFPLIAQKMTVLSHRLRPEYEKALFCSWFSMALAAQLSASSEFIEDAFIAGLVHDMGMLHIDSNIAEKTGEYTAEEWRAVQSHTLIADVFLSYVEKLSPNVRRAVREHHERCDGSGYPAALVENKLCITGQLIGMADTVWAICKRPTRRKGISIGDVITITRMNKEQHPLLVESALYRVYQKIDALAVLPALPPMPLNIKEHLGKKGQRMQSAYAVIARLNRLLQPSEADRVQRSAYVRLNRLMHVFNGSGLLTHEILEWLNTHEAEDSSTISYDLYELSLMYSEFEWQLFQFSRALQQVANHAKALNVEATDVITSVITHLEPLLVNERSVVTNEQLIEVG